MQTPDLDVEHLRFALQLIKVARERGLFNVNMYERVGNVRDQLRKALEAVETHDKSVCDEFTCDMARELLSIVVIASSTRSGFELDEYVSVGVFARILSKYMSPAPTSGVEEAKTE